MKKLARQPYTSILVDIAIGSSVRGTTARIVVSGTITVGVVVGAIGIAVIISITRGSRTSVIAVALTIGSVVIDSAERGAGARAAEAGTTFAGHD